MKGLGYLECVVSTVAFSKEASARTFCLIWNGLDLDIIDTSPLTHLYFNNITTRSTSRQNEFAL
jgi:hypothetical protein